MIAICPNPFRDNGLELTEKVRGILSADGYETAVCPVFSEDDPSVLPSGVEPRRLRDLLPQCTLVVVIGGDGTILAVARAMRGTQVPIIGVNLGTKGFMSGLEPEDIRLISKAARNEIKVSRRMMLDVQLMRGGEQIYSDCALNDVVLHGYGDCIKLTAWCRDARITSYSGDGIILATPTGSTGYSMSAGGPIVEPDAANIIVSPICAHIMGARSFVLDPERTVTVMTEKLHGRRAYLSVDGNSVADLSNGDIINVKRSDNCTLMADFGIKNFYEIAYEKLT